MATRISILIAEDSMLLRRLLMQQLAREPDFNLVGEAENGQDAVHMALELKPDVILMDLDMPITNGIQATEQILAQAPQIRVLLLTAYGNLAAMGQMVGAADCLSKSCTPTELTSAIRKAYSAKQTAAPDDSQARLQIVMDRIGLVAELTDREKVVVYKMVSTDDTALQIAHTLSVERKEKVTESAVKHTLERAMNKLHIEPHTRASLVKYVMGQVKGAN